MWAVIRESDSKLVNVIMWDGESPWSPPEGHRVEPFDPALHVWDIPAQAE